MHPKSPRRVHGAEFKARVLSQCREAGASVAAVALAHGLNVNLVRKWLVGRGLKRAGLATPGAAMPMPSMQFVPLELPAAARREAPSATEPPRPAEPAHPPIRIELRRGGTHLTVHWPSAQAPACLDWLREIVGTLT